MWKRFEELHQFGVAVVSDATLASEVVVVGGDELAERHATSGKRPQQVNDLATELVHLVRQQWTRTHFTPLCNVTKTQELVVEKHELRPYINVA